MYSESGGDTAFLYEWYCYFAVHFLSTRDWAETHKLMHKLAAISTAECPDGMKEHIHRVFVDYVQCINRMEMDLKQQFIGKYRDKINNLMVVLHDKHIEFVQEINSKSMKVMKVKHEDEDEDQDDDIDLELNKRFNYNSSSTNNYYLNPPKIDILSVLVDHVLLFRNIGNERFATQILKEVVVFESKCLNETSKYLSHYPIDKVNENEVHSLLSLFI